MRPGHLAHEPLQEHRARGGARLARPADVLDVGDLGLDVLGVGVAERHPPEPLADRLAGRDQLGGQLRRRG